MENNVKLVECLLCQELKSKLSLLSHIAEHVGYFRFQCKDCDFKTTYGHCLVEHEFETGHATDTNVKSTYLERICNFIYSDCVYNNIHGLDAMYARKHLTTWKGTNEEVLLNQDDQPISKTDFQNANSKSTLPLSFVLNNAKKNKKKKNNVVENEVSSNMIETPCTSTSLTPKEKEDENKKQSASSNLTLTSPYFQADEDDHITELEMLEFSRQVNRGRPTLQCAKCNIVVVNEYRSQKEHVKKYHVKDFTDVDERDNFISKFIEVCFPGAIAINDFQCCICGHEMRSMSGRRFHVGREHLFFSMPCPKKNCKSNFFTVDKVNEHLKVLHTNQLLSDDEKRDYDIAKRRYNNKLRVLVSKCFPCPLPITTFFNQDLFTFDNNEKQRCLKNGNKRLRTENGQDLEQSQQESNLLLREKNSENHLNFCKKQKKIDEINLIVLDQDEDNDIEVSPEIILDDQKHSTKTKCVNEKKNFKSFSSSSDSETEEQKRKSISEIIDAVSSEDVKKRAKNVYSLKSGRYTSIKAQDVLKENNDSRKDQDLAELSSSSSSSSSNSFSGLIQAVVPKNFVTTREEEQKNNTEANLSNLGLNS